MKTVLNTGVAGLLVLVAGLFGFSVYRFNSYRPQSVALEPLENNLQYFQGRYEECRTSFRKQAGKLLSLYGGVKISSLEVKSQKETDLTIDYCYIPPLKKKKRLLILTSGVHGVEGFVGSAVQQMFLNEIASEARMENMGVLLIHGINPYGFKNKRRVTENNIDLNRNCKSNANLYEIKNDGYSRLNAWLNSKRKVSLTKFEHFFFPFYAAKKVFKYSMDDIRQAILQGQYQYEQGIYYGGKVIEPLMLDLTTIIKEAASPYEMVFAIDLHTGYGENGTLHLFQSPLDDETKTRQLEQIFNGFSIDWGDTKGFYTVTGDFMAYLESLFSHKHFLPMVFEFGTLDTGRFFGSIKALHNVMIENQGYHHGYATPEDEATTKDRFLQGYYPSSDAWRSKVIEDSRYLLKQVLETYEQVQLTNNNGVK